MSNTRISGHLLLAFVCAPLLTGAACEKKKPTADTGALTAMERAESTAGPTDTTPLPGIDVSKLEADRQTLFYKLIGSLTSPCGKTHSLRTSFTQDTACKRAPFAVKYVRALVEDETAEAEIRTYYTSKYDPKGEKPKLDVSKAPRIGNDDAPVRLVEFFDYACPHCQMFAPILHKVEERQRGKVVEYFMSYPLEAKHPNSRSAAQAAIAANAQGKFKEMHLKLFERSPAHDKNAVMGYAQELGLDLAKFQTDYAAANAQVSGDLAQGEGAGVSKTPTLFFNDRAYEGPLSAEYLEMWIEEEIAVNR